uniref:Uncharacterized protein n=1 Tax=Anguilla anguilla TaxID=7936 RepID=A0A0E9XT16_ANGAN
MYCLVYLYFHFSKENNETASGLFKSDYRLPKTKAVSIQLHFCRVHSYWISINEGPPSLLKHRR